MRIGLFLLTNAAVVTVLSIVLNILGIGQGAIGISGLVVMASLFGMGGAFISLMMSKSMAVRSVNAKVIEEPESDAERWLLTMVENQSKQVGVGLPVEAIFNSTSLNAFGTGASREKALVAVSTGLLSHMSSKVVEAASL